MQLAAFSAEFDGIPHGSRHVGARGPRFLQKVPSALDKTRVTRAWAAATPTRSASEGARGTPAWPALRVSTKVASEERQECQHERAPFRCIIPRKPAKEAKGTKNATKSAFVPDDPLTSPRRHSPPGSQHAKDSKRDGILNRGCYHFQDRHFGRGDLPRPQHSTIFHSQPLSNRRITQPAMARGSLPRAGAAASPAWSQSRLDSATDFRAHPNCQKPRTKLRKLKSHDLGLPGRALRVLQHSFWSRFLETVKHFRARLFQICARGPPQPPTPRGIKKLFRARFFATDFLASRPAPQRPGR